MQAITILHNKMSKLRDIPNVGKGTEQDLAAMCHTTIESLKGKKAGELYAEECALRDTPLIDASFIFIEQSSIL